MQYLCMKKKKCYMCKKYLAHDSNFGYCKKYKTQAKSNDSCDTIVQTLPP